MNGDNNETQTRRNVPERQNAKKNKTRNPKKTKQKRNGRRRRRFPTSWRIVDDEIGLTRHRPLSTNKMSAKPKWVFFFFYRNSMKENKKKEGVAEERKVGLRRNSIFGGSFLLFFFSGLFFSSSICVCVCVCVNVGAVVNKNQNTFSDANYGTNYGTVIIALGPRWKNKRERKKERKKERRTEKKKKSTHWCETSRDRTTLLLVLFSFSSLSSSSSSSFSTSSSFVDVVSSFCCCCLFFLQMIFVCLFFFLRGKRDRKDEHDTADNVQHIDYRLSIHTLPPTDTRRSRWVHAHTLARPHFYIDLCIPIDSVADCPTWMYSDRPIFFLFFYWILFDFTGFVWSAFTIRIRSFVRFFFWFTGSRGFAFEFWREWKVFTNQNKKKLGTIQ